MNHNSSIGCTVTECRHHCNEDNYCTLNKVEIIKHEAKANTAQCTDCGSFQLR